MTQQLSRFLSTMCAQGAAMNRGLLHPDPKIRFCYEQVGALPLKPVAWHWQRCTRSLKDIRILIQESKQGPYRSSTVRVWVTSDRTSFWQWEWRFKISQGEELDLVAKSDEFQKDWEKYFSQFKVEYPQVVLNDNYYLSQIDRYWPDVEI